jgi:hypothetical protein
MARTGVRDRVACGERSPRKLLTVGASGGREAIVRRLLLQVEVVSMDRSAAVRPSWAASAYALLDPRDATNPTTHVVPAVVLGGGDWRPSRGSR